MTDEKYTFSYEYGDTRVIMTIGQDLDVHQMCAQFENFLLATGYRLREHESIGVTDENEEESGSKVDEYLGGLFDGDSGVYMKFDGANAFGDNLSGAQAAEANSFYFFGSEDDDVVSLK